MEYTIINITDPGAAAELAAIERDCFTHPMTEPQVSSMLQQKTSCFFAAREGGSRQIVGSLWLQTVLDEGYIGNVAVLPAWRRRGIGDALLDRAECFARERTLAFLTLEVRAANTPAIALYEKHGFRRVGLRRGYYSDPKEDALLMTKEFERNQL